MAAEARLRRSFDPGLFRRAMGSFASGVTIVTVPDGDAVHAMTASAFISASLAPPLCVVAVAKRARMHALIAAAQYFGVTVLAEHQEPIARRFGGQPATVATVAYEEMARAPVLSEGVARIATTLYAAHDCGDHTLYVGEILDAVVSEQPPLLYYRSAFRAFRPDRARHPPAPEFW
jgi:flavin reductase (DIM6/NTAB) family NADH-FMN oxidoreductase RutF